MRLPSKAVSVGCSVILGFVVVLVAGVMLLLYSFDQWTQ